jgi:hypothetical protein
LQKNLMVWGSRPSSFGSLRMVAILGANTEGSCPLPKIASACLDANDDPALQRAYQICLLGETCETYVEVPA